MRGGLALAAVLLLFGSPLRAEPGNDLPRDVSGLCHYLGTPVRPDRALDAWETVRHEDPVEAIRLAAALGLSGGVGALVPLDELLRDRDASVRLTAIRAVGRVGLRDARLVTRLRERIRWSSGGEQRACLLALGRVGDGRDVATLLDLARDEDEMLSLTAFRALRPLTGVRLPPVHARWSYWWRSTERRLRSDLARGMDAIEMAPEGPDAERQRELVAQCAWVDVMETERRLRAWFDVRDDALRRHAILLVGQLGLADLSGRVERIYRFSQPGGDLGAALDEVLLAFGLVFPMDPLLPELPAAPALVEQPLEAEAPAAPDDSAPVERPQDASDPAPSDDPAPVEEPASDEDS